MEDSSMLLTEKIGRIKDLADLTIICGEHAFKIHKAYACAESPVIARALQGSFIEAKSGVLNMSFDVQSVRRFIEYLYSGYYHVSLDPAIELLASAAPDKACTVEENLSSGGNNGLDSEATGTGNQDSDMGGYNAETQSLEDTQSDISEESLDLATCHGRMNCMADYYAMPDLAELSLMKAKRNLQKHWSTEKFCYLAQRSIGSTGDQNFLQMLGDIAADHIYELYQQPKFSEMDLAKSLAVYILPKAASKLNPEIMERELRLRNKCVELLENHVHCGSLGCQGKFSGILELMGSTYVLRCEECGAYHE